MKTAYGILGLTLLLVFSVAYVFVNRAHAPTVRKRVSEPTNSHYESNLPPMRLSSSAFENNSSIPPQFTCDGENVNPELSIQGVPQEAESLVLLMDDPDIPDSVKESRGIEKFDHWVLFNIPPDEVDINENSIPEGAKEGANSSGNSGYTGPCPPDREHRYFFKLYALDTKLDMRVGSSMAEVEKEMDGHVLEKTELIGLYNRTQ